LKYPFNIVECKLFNSQTFDLFVNGPALFFRPKIFPNFLAFKSFLETFEIEKGTDHVVHIVKRKTFDGKVLSIHL